MKALQDPILPPSRRKAWDGLPKLDLRQRSLFICDTATQRVINRIKENDYKVGFLLQVVYFSCKRQFFPASHFPAEHIRSARKALALPPSTSTFRYPADVASRHKSKILSTYGWQPFDREFKEHFSTIAQSLIDKRRKKSDIVDVLLEFCLEQNREVPSYSVVKDIIQSGYNLYETTLGRQLQKRLSADQRRTLADLAAEPEMFLLARNIKRIDQGTQRQPCRQNGQILGQCQALYAEFESVLDILQLTQEATDDLAIWVKGATAPQVRNFRDIDRRNLHLLAYLQYQYFNRSDAAVDAIKKIVTKLKNEARTFQNRVNEKQEKELLDATAALSDVTRNSKALINKIIEIGYRSNQSVKDRLEEIIGLAEAFMLADLEDVDAVLQKVDDDVTKKRRKLDYYHYLFRRSKSIQGLIGPLLKHLVFDESSDRRLLVALKGYQKGLLQVTDKTPVGFLSKSEQDLIFRQDEFSSTEKYKVLLFIQLFESLKDQSLTLKYSYKYRPTESYFIPLPLWLKTRDQIMTSTRLMDYRDPVTYLGSIGKAVTDLYNVVNSRIDSDENTHIKFRNDGTWWVDTPATDFSTDQFVAKLLGEDASLSLYQILHQVNTYAGFTDELEHRTKRYASEGFNLSHAYAAIMSLGTNIGHNQMSKACSDITLKQLRDIESNRFSIANLKKANDSIVQLIQSLSLPGVYSDDEGRLHTSSDGRKIVVSVDSLMANFSYKYYGKDKGISANSFIDDQQIFFNVNVLTSSEREAPYMLEGMAESKRTLYPETKLRKESHLHSTDTHALYI